MSLYLKQIEVGPMANFTYFIGDSETKEVVLVDPAWQVDTLMRTAEKENLNVVGALITHGHFDHCNGIEELLERKQMPIYVHAQEVDFVRSITTSKDSLFGSFPEEHTRRVRSGDQLKIGQVEITFLHTPGHTPGSQCFLVQDHLVSGDTLFIRGCGRCDLPGGNAEQMYDSLTKKLMKLPEKTLILPGHNYSDAVSATLAEEKKKNPYLICDNLKTFLHLVGK